MAVRTGVSVGDYLSRTSNPPAPCTFGAWVQRVGTYGNPGTPMRLGTAGDYVRLETFDDGGGLPDFSGIGSDAGTNDFSLGIATTGWYFMACAAPTTGNGTGWTGLVGASSLEVLSGPNWNNLTATSVLGIGADPNDTFANWNGRIANAWIYDAILTTRDVEQLFRLLRPKRRANLWAWWPLVNNRFDYSGNGRHLTENGTITYAEHPPVQWGDMTRSRRSAVAAAPPAYLPQLYQRRPSLARF